MANHPLQFVQFAWIGLFGRASFAQAFLAENPAANAGPV